MTRGPEIKLPQALQMPLRDLLRGLSSFAEATEEALEPAAALLPQPMRDTFGAALRRIEGESHRLVRPAVSHSDIAVAAAYLSGQSTDLAQAETCARVLALAWDQMQGGKELAQTMVSETIAATRLAATRSVGDPCAVAAAIFLDLRRSHVAGHFPGLPVPASEAEQAAIDLKLIAFFIWLLAERGADLDSELQLLDMAMALTQAFRDDVLSSTGEAAALSERLRMLSQHL